MYKKYPKGLKLTPDKEYLVIENMGIAKKLAHNWFNGVVEFDDLYQQARLTLVDCATKFDPSMPNKFTTYAYNCINIVLNNYVQNYNKTVSIPLNKIYKIHKYLKLPDEEKEEYRIKSKITLEDIKFYSTYEMVSMDAQIVDDYEGVTNFYEDKRDLYKELEDKLTLKKILKSLNTLIPDKTERLIFFEVIKNDFDTSTYKEIAKKYGLKLKDMCEIIEKCQSIMREHKKEFM